MSYNALVDEQLPNGFRSSSEMLTVYNGLETDGLVNQPYIVKVAKHSQQLTFFGSRHSNDVTDRQVYEIETEWQQFVASTNHHKLAICEGGIRTHEANKDDAIKKNSETGLIIWLADRAKIDIISPEPDPDKEIAYLHAQGFDTGQIVAYYFGRQMYQWLERDYKTQPDWRSYADFFVSKHASTKTFDDGHLSLESVLEMFKAVTGKPFDPQARSVLYNLSDPSANPVSSASGLFRDISLMSAITTAWNAGNDIFALYGSGHAIVLENAILSLA
jgi:hypothetical protein